MSQTLRILLTAGPTREALDPVRYFSNRSSGQMGFAIAAQAAARGHRVDLICGPVSLAPLSHPLVATAWVESAQQMYAAVKQRIPFCEVAVMSAAVADYRPVRVAPQKIKKSEDHLTIQLERTPDILASARAQMNFRGILVGFAAETERIEENALKKLESKQCDLIVANDVSRQDIGFESSWNELALYFADGRREVMRKAPKAELAKRLIEIIEGLANSSHEP